MAFWNAPVDVADHPRAACAAALRMQADIATLNERRAAEAAPDDPVAVLPIDVGIGINTGACVVGNMGSDMRFDYTALGDAVNLASRLEGQCKTYGVKIVLGEATARAADDGFALIEIDLIRVKGKTAPERIFTLLGGAEMRADPQFVALAAANAGMRAAYGAQDWATVLPALERIEVLGRALDLPLDGYVALYRERCETFLAAPPLADWDGVYTAEVK